MSNSFKLFRTSGSVLSFTTGSQNQAPQAMFSTGSSAAPAITFVSDPDTGLYRPGQGRRYAIMTCLINKINDLEEKDGKEVQV